MILDIFPTKIYRSVYTRAEDLKDTLFPKIVEVLSTAKENNNEFMKDGTVCSYNTGSELHKQFPKETAAIVNFVNEEAAKYWKICNYHEELEPFVYQMWANSTPKGGWIENHLHGNMPFTAVLYVDASPEQGNIVLENPLDTVLMTQPIGPKVEYPMRHELTVNTGDFVMFPGYLKHSVKPNTSDRTRLILAFNIGCRGQYWSAQWTR